jgi:signal transduction histidine kinase
MRKLRWDVSSAAFVAACMVGVGALFPLFSPEAVDLAGTAAAASLIVHAIVLVAAAFIYLHWRLSGSPLAGWLTLAVVTLSAPNLSVAAVLMVDPGTPTRGPWWSLVAGMSVAAGLFMVLLLAGRSGPLPVRALPVDPLAAGLLAGIACSAAALALVRWAPELHVAPAVMTGLLVLTVLLTLGVGYLCVRQAHLSSWVRFEVPLGLVLVTAGDVAQFSPLAPNAARGLTLSSCLVGGALLCHIALSLIRMTIRANRQEVHALHKRLGQIESSVRDSRARLHEVASTVAGITSVSRIINEPTVALPHQRRSLLERTLSEELGRLGRLTAGDPSPEGTFALDDLVCRLVTAQRAQGRSVRWQPSGALVRGRQDDLAEALHVLLDNAAKHGRGTGASIEVRRRGSMVEISISDRGPGVAPELRSRVFDWGTRGSDSRGQGIGLHVARQLVEQQGGYLTLDGSPPIGTTFVLGVPVGERHDAVSHRAG